MESTLSDEANVGVSVATGLLMQAGLTFVLVVGAGPGRGGDIFSNLESAEAIRAVCLQLADFSDLESSQVERH